MNSLLMKAACLFTLGGFIACSSRDRAPEHGYTEHERDTDVSKNIFTGTKTVTTTDETTTKNYDTGKKYKSKVVKKVKYDSDGNRISDSTETDNSAR